MRMASTGLQDISGFAIYSLRHYGVKSVAILRLRARRGDEITEPRLIRTEKEHVDSAMALG